MLRNLFGLLWLLVGGMLAMTGVLYRIPGGLRDPAHPFVNLLNDLANVALQLPVDIKTQLLVDSHGLLPVFGGAGGVFALIGFYLLLTRSVAKPQTAAPPPTIKITKKHAKGAVVRDKPQAVASASATDEAESLFDNAERLVALSHGNFSAAMALQVIRHYHPNLVPFLDCFSDDAKASYARQTVSHAILVLKRTERGIAVDQFKGHDEKMNHLERETFARLYAPKGVASMSESVKQYIGRVYALAEQSQIQHALLSDASDWVDLSLRNAELVLNENAALFAGGGAAARV